MNSDEIRVDNPTAAAERIRANPKLLEEGANPNLLLPDTIRGTNYLVRLAMDNGYFQFNWSATTYGSYDWVGLYVNESLPDSDYIGGNNWQWAVQPSPYTTSTPAQLGYQARYLVWDAKTRDYKAVAHSDPWKG
jgi:hypothetical protein